VEGVDMSLEEIPVFHLYSASEEKPLKKDERQRLLDELRKKLAEMKEIKRRLHALEQQESHSPPSGFSLSSPQKESPASASLSHAEKDIQQLTQALEELHVPALELLYDRPRRNKQTNGA
jgi:hypothetical protein